MGANLGIRSGNASRGPVDVVRAASSYNLE